MKNIGQLMKQAQAMQEKMAEMQSQLEAVEMIGVAGGGTVQLTLNGKGDLRKVKLDKTLIDPAEIEVLEDLIVAAFNDARRKVSAHAEQEMHKLRRPGLARRYQAPVLIAAAYLYADSRSDVRTRHLDPAPCQIARTRPAFCATSSVTLGQASGEPTRAAGRCACQDGGGCSPLSDLQ